MQILVAVSEVSLVDDKFEIDGLGIGNRYLTYDRNEWDNNAIEEAVQFAEVDDDIKVIAVTVGPERSEEVIRQALAKGLTGRSGSGTRVLTKSTQIAAVVGEEQPDLILTGVQSGDDSHGATGVALAEAVGYEWAAVVNNLDLERDRELASVTEN